MSTQGRGVQPSGPSVTSASGGGYARRSSGLVRDFSQLDTWIYNTLAMNIIANGILAFALLSLTYPRANIPLAFLIAGLFCCFEAVVYALFQAAMPRTGGDYVFQSRVFGGGYATVFAFSGTTLVQIFTYAIAGFVIATAIFSPAFVMLGAYYGLHWLTSVGTWLSGKWGIFTCGMIAAVWGSLVNIRGLRVYAILQRWFFWIGLFLLAILVIAVAATSRGGFIHHLNSFVGDNFGTKNAYQVTLKRGGSVDTSFDLAQTIKASVIAAFALIFPAYSVMQAGEIRRANSVRANLAATLGAEVFTTLGLALIGALLVSRAGHGFLYSSGTLFYGGAANNPLPVPPSLGFFFSIAGGHAVFVWITLAMVFCWVMMWFPNSTLGASRNVMAMAFDGILPGKLAAVNSRFHTPVFAILLYGVISIPAVILYAFSSSFQAFTFGFFIVFITNYGATMLAGLFFPYRRKRLYEESPAAAYKFLGIPLISLAAVVFLAFVIYVDYQALTADELGLNGNKGLIFLGAMYGVAIITYLIAWFYQRQRGVRLTSAYQQLPIE